MTNKEQLNKLKELLREFSTVEHPPRKDSYFYFGYVNIDTLVLIFSKAVKRLNKLNEK